MHLIKSFYLHFQALKRRGRAVDELPSEIKIDCFTVNCVSVKNTIEHLLQNLFDALLNCLRRSIQADMVTADAFLSGIVRLIIFLVKLEHSLRPFWMPNFSSKARFYPLYVIAYFSLLQPTPNSILRNQLKLRKIPM